MYITTFRHTMGRPRVPRLGEQHVQGLKWGGELPVGVAECCRSHGISGTTALLYGKIASVGKLAICRFQPQRQALPRSFEQHQDKVSYLKRKNGCGTYNLFARYE